MAIYSRQVVAGVNLWMNNSEIISLMGLLDHAKDRSDIQDGESQQISAYIGFLSAAVNSEISEPQAVDILNGNEYGEPPAHE